MKSKFLNVKFGGIYKEWVSVGKGSDVIDAAYSNSDSGMSDHIFFFCERYTYKLSVCQLRVLQAHQNTQNLEIKFIYTQKTLNPCAQPTPCLPYLVIYSLENRNSFHLLPCRVGYAFKMLYMGMVSFDPCTYLLETYWEKHCIMLVIVRNAVYQIANNLISRPHMSDTIQKGKRAKFSILLWRT